MGQVWKSTGPTLLLLKHTVPWPHLATWDVQYVLQYCAQEEKMDFREHLSVSATTTSLISLFPLVFLSAVKNSKFLEKQIFISAYMPYTTRSPRDSYSNKCSLAS